MLDIFRHCMPNTAYSELVYKADNDQTKRKNLLQLGYLLGTHELFSVACTFPYILR